MKTEWALNKNKGRVISTFNSHRVLSKHARSMTKTHQRSGENTSPNQSISI